MFRTPNQDPRQSHHMRGWQTQCLQSHVTEGSHQSSIPKGKKAQERTQKVSLLDEGLEVPWGGAVPCWVHIYICYVYVCVMHICNIYGCTYYIYIYIVLKNEPLRSLKQQLARPPLSPQFAFGSRCLVSTTLQPPPPCLKAQEMGPVPYLCCTPGKASIIMSSLVIQKPINLCHEYPLVNQIIRFFLPIDHCFI